MKKRIISLFAALILIASLLPSAVIGSFAETTSGQCGATAYWSFDSETGVLTITGTGKVYSNTFGNINIRTVVIGDGITTLCEGVFNDRSSILSVTMADSVTAIEQSAFYRCTSLESVKLSANLTSIGPKAFYQCSALKTLELPDTLNSLGEDAFTSCKSLESINIPAALETLGSARPFSGCNALERIDVDPSNATFKSVDGVLFSKDGTVLVKYPSNREAGSYEIPGGVKIPNRSEIQFSVPFFMKIGTGCNESVFVNRKFLQQPVIRRRLQIEVITDFIGIAHDGIFRLLQIITNIILNHL